MKVKLKVAKVLSGSVWPAGSVVDMPEKQARLSIEKGEAEAVSSTPAQPVNQDQKK